MSDAVDAMTAPRFEAHVPVVNLLFKASIWFWLTIAHVFVCISLHAPAGRAMPAVVLLVNCLTLFLGPGSLYRYASPLFTSLPVLLVMLADFVRAADRTARARPAHMHRT